MEPVFKLINETTGQDISPYVISLEWSGDLEQAGRQLNFKLAYTPKDPQWVNARVAVGDRVAVSADMTPIFSGVVFMVSRDSSAYTMEFVAYDKLIYYAKNRFTLKFQATAKDAILSVIAKMGDTAGRIDDSLTYPVNFIADNLSATEIIKKILKRAEEEAGYSYHIYMSPDNAVNVVRADTVIEGYRVSGETNAIAAQHSASIADMVNRVAIADKDGNITGFVENEEDVSMYGAIQTVYKINDKDNTQKAARSLLKRIAEHSTVSALGNIQCIAGYAVNVSEENIDGTFLIVHDQHTIEDSVHTMKLSLSYIQREPAPPEEPGQGALSVSAGLEAGADAWVGQTMDNGVNGCAEAAGKIGSYYSPFLAEECRNGVVSVPQMVSDAGALYQPFNAASVEAGDVIVYGDNDHVVIASGGGGEYVGNSSSQNKVIRGDNFYNMGGLYPTGIIKTSRG